MRDITVFDIETADLHNTKICAVGFAIIHDGVITDSFTELVDPECEFGEMNIRIHHITPKMVRGCPTFPEVWEKYSHLFTDNIVAAHGATTADFNYLKKTLAFYGREMPEMDFICTLELAKQLVPGAPDHKLKTLGKYYGISFDNHDAGQDSMTCALLLTRWIAQGADIESYVKHYTPKKEGEKSKPKKHAPHHNRVYKLYDTDDTTESKGETDE